MNFLTTTSSWDFPDRVSNLKMILRNPSKLTHKTWRLLPFHVKEGVSVLMDEFKQFANKNIIECAKDGIPDVFLRCMNPQAAQSSINDDDVSTSEPGRNYMQATYKLGPFSFPSSLGEYPDVRIAVFLNYAPDDELDKKGNPTLHFQRDVGRILRNIIIFRVIF
jgi:hypothetical protein